MYCGQSGYFLNKPRAFFYYACPITLGNTTCWVIIGYTSGNILRCATLHCSELNWFHLCYSKSKSVDSIKVMNGFLNFIINSCLLIGPCQGWTMFFFRVPLCFARSLHWYNRWSTVWSPCLQTHAALSDSLNRWRGALVFPCPVVIAAILGETLIFMLSLSWTVGKYSFVIAAFVHFTNGVHICVGITWYRYKK